MKGPLWTEEQLATLRRLYPTTSPREVAAAVGRPLKSVYCKANDLGLKTTAPGRTGRKPSPTLASIPCLPASKPARATARGPAYLDGPLVFTDKTRRVVGPAMPQPTRSNTHNTF